MRELAGVILIGIVAAVFMFRWDIEAGSGTGATAVFHFKLDRFSGTSYICRVDTCTRLEDAD